MLAIVISLYLLLLIAANFPPAQRYLAGLAEGILSEKLQTKVEIDRLELGLFNRVTLHDVRVFDQMGDTLLNARLMSAKIEYMPLLKGKVALRTVSLLDSRIRLYQTEAGSAPNYQFVLEAFKSKKQGPSKLNLSLGSLIIRRTAVNYDLRYKPHTPGRFSSAHLHLSGIDANVSLRSLTPDRVNLRIRHLAFKEQSGLTVDHLALRFEKDKDSLAVSDFDLRLPHSRLMAKNLTAIIHPDKHLPLTRRLTLSGRLSSEGITPADLASFVPRLSAFSRPLELDMAFGMKQDTMRVQQITLTEKDNGLVFNADGFCAFRQGKISTAQVNLHRLDLDADRLASGLGAFKASDTIANKLSALGNVALKGQGVYRPDGVSRLNMDCHTAIGDVTVGAHGRRGDYAFQTTATGLRPGRLVSSPLVPDELAFQTSGRIRHEGTGWAVSNLSVNVDRLTYGAKNYSGIQLEGNVSPSQLAATLVSTHPDLHMRADIHTEMAAWKPSRAQVSVEMDRLCLSADRPMGLTDSRLSGSVVSGSLKGEAEWSDGRLSGGELLLSHISKTQPAHPERDYALDHLHLAITPTAEAMDVKLESDFATARLTGDLSAPILTARVKALIAQLTTDQSLSNPSHLVAAKSERKDAPPADFRLTLRRDDFFQRVLGLPLSFTSPVEIEGRLAKADERSYLTLSAPSLDFGAGAINRCRVYANMSGSQAEAIVQGMKRVGKGDMRFALTSKSHAGQIESELVWDDGLTHRWAGTLRAATAFSKDAVGRSIVTTQVLPSAVTMADTLWQVNPGTVVASGGAVDVSRVGLSYGNRSLSLSGRLSKQPEDSLQVHLSQVDISYILSLINLKPVSFGGRATGTLTAQTGSQGGIDIGSTLHIPDFLFNDGFMGNSRIGMRLNTSDMRLHFDADMQELGEGATTVRGYVGIKEKALNLHIGSRRTTLHFLRRYVSDLFDNLSGRITGRCHIMGTFKEIDFEGEEQAEIFAKVRSTGCNYHLTDGTVTIRPGEFAMNGFKISDSHGGNGTISGTLRHQHIKNITYDFRAETSRLKIYQTGPESDLPFYATAYGTGTAHLSGRPGLFSADINMQTDPGTVITYITETPESEADVSLLRFVSHEADAANQTDTASTAIQPQSPSRPPVTAPSTDIRLGFMVRMTPSATLKVITDADAGNHLLLNGNGTIRATYYNKGAFEMFGHLGVTGGAYKMTIQDVIHKDFTLRDGGTIDFAGNPFDGRLNLSAVYTVPSVSLADLGLNFNDRTVRADCILKIGGRAGAPAITFDLGLPDVGEDVQQMVRNVISSEDDINMQILYLLGVGRFYNYNFASTQAAMGGQSQSNVAMKSFLSSTLSSQLNNFLSDALGTTNWTFGTTLQTGQVGWSDMEVGGLLSGRMFSGRLLINGNFGYRERTTSSTNFVGDFDVTYRLTPSGGVSLKAYSETNDRYFSKSSLTTQGIGIQLQRDFTGLRDLFTPRERRKNKADSARQ
ncbi:MAG: translocation/assembly module TamB domain-containing protein [Alloprevotella sp.]